MTDTDTVVTIVAAITIVVGIFGTFIPFVPGLVLSWLGVLVWSIFADGGAGKWIVFVIATVLAVLGTVLKYLLPGRNMKREGVPMVTLLAGGVLAIVGFFVVPFVGLFLGFVLGVFLSELALLKSARLAWPATWKAVKAVGLSVFIEIFAGLCILLTFIIGVLLTP
jgi:uncharacterized protein YqgC (DUF456 family)